MLFRSITGFDEIPKKLWIKFSNMTDYEKNAEELFSLLADSDGKDGVVIYIEADRAMKKLPPNKNVCADEELLARLSGKFGKDNIKIVWDKTKL